MAKGKTTVKAAKPAKAPKKTKAKAKKAPPKNSTPYEMPDGSIIDLDSFDWGKNKLSERQKLFVFWYSCPQTPYYHNAYKSAVKAGYTPNTARNDSFHMRRNPVIDKMIRQFEESIGKTDILDAAERFLHEKIIRGDYDIKDFYKVQQYEDVKGKPRNAIVLKDLEELTPEQRLCIDGIAFVGQTGLPVYNLADRQKERDSLIAFAQKQNEDKGGDDFDVETVTELIKGNIQVKTKVINHNRDIMEKAEGFMDAPKKIIEEE
jgi:hypothetical protein